MCKYGYNKLWSLASTMLLWSSELMQHMTRGECHDITKPCQTMTVDSFKLGKCFQYFWFIAIWVSVLVFFSIEQVKWKRTADTVVLVTYDSCAHQLHHCSHMFRHRPTLSSHNACLRKWSDLKSILHLLHDTFIYSVRLRKLLYLIFCLHTIVARCYRHATGREYYRLSWPLDMAAT